MSLHPQPIGRIPTETRRIALAALPQGTVVTRLRDEFADLYRDEDFAALYPRRGQPGLAPWRLAFVTVLQFLEHLSDRQAADAVRSRIDWKYALGLRLDDPGFHFSVLTEFRARLLPRQWSEDRARYNAAGIPDEVAFATKPQIARRMLERALDAGVPCAWVTGDEVYGGDRHLRLWLESRDQSFVMAVARNEPLWWQGPEYTSAQEIAQLLSPQAWRQLSAGPGAKGERLYDWALAPLWRLQLSREERRWGHYLLVRRSRDDKRELAYYVVYAQRAKAQLKTLVAVAGRRWEIEVGFEATKGECGLDQYEVRRWQGWYRHITLALLAHAVLVAVRAQEKKTTAPRSRPHCPERARAAPAALAPRLAGLPDGRPGAALVGLATTAPVPGAAVPLRA